MGRLSQDALERRLAAKIKTLLSHSLPDSSTETFAQLVDSIDLQDATTRRIFDLLTLETTSRRPLRPRQKLARLTVDEQPVSMDLTPLEPLAGPSRNTRKPIRVQGPASWAALPPIESPTITTEAELLKAFTADDVMDLEEELQSGREDDPRTYTRRRLVIADESDSEATVDNEPARTTAPGVTTMDWAAASDEQPSVQLSGTWQASSRRTLLRARDVPLSERHREAPTQFSPAGDPFTLDRHLELRDAGLRPAHPRCADPECRGFGGDINEEGELLCSTCGMPIVSHRA